MRDILFIPRESMQVGKAKNAINFGIPVYLDDEGFLQPWTIHKKNPIAGVAVSKIIGDDWEGSYNVEIFSGVAKIMQDTLKEMAELKKRVEKLEKRRR